MDSERLDGIVAKCVQQTHPQAWAAYVFGSAGTEWERKDSDVDVAILTEAPGVNLDALRDALVQALGREVDLIDLRSAPTMLKKEVLMSGRTVWVGEDFLTGLYEVQVMSEYQRLCREIAEIVEDGLRSGRFYE